MKVRARVLVEGEVQGVGFRSSVWSIARRLQLAGCVRNLADGRVEAIIEGERDKVENMVKWCNRGPSGAYVTNVKVEWQPYKGEYKEFEILRARLH
nr:acylphosphatase [Candidatus Njordarchaeota archaeon]